MALLNRDNLAEPGGATQSRCVARDETHREEDQDAQYEQSGDDEQ